MNFQPIFWGGLIAGTLDICAAFLTAWLRAGVGPVRVLHFVASGLIGATAFDGGAKTAILGLVLHFLIATVAAVVFYIASQTTVPYRTSGKLRPAIRYRGLPVYELRGIAALARCAAARDRVGTRHWRADDYVLHWRPDRSDRASLLAIALR